MFKQLSQVIGKPALWQRSERQFWNDEHISQMMLDAHLNPNINAASRRLVTIDKSVEWLRTVIPPQSKVLDMGCGPGLYSKRLSALGYNVTGMDISARSLNYAKMQDDKTTYLLQDYLQMDFNGQFDAVILIFCDYAALTPTQRVTLLGNVKRALKPNGIFVFDVFTPTHYRSNKDTKVWSSSEGGFWNKNPYLCLSATYHYLNNAVLCNQYVIVTNNDVAEYVIWDSLFTKETINDELSQNGFMMRNIYSDVCGKEYSATSETLCLIAQPIY